MCIGSDACILCMLGLASAARTVQNFDSDFEGTGKLVHSDYGGPSSTADAQELRPAAVVEVQTDNKGNKKKDIDQIDEVLHSNQRSSMHQAVHKIHNLPLVVRLCVVSLLLATPMIVILCLIKFTPEEQLSSSIVVKSAMHCGYAFTVGWLNCVMLLRYRSFATMMVGNTILMGVAVVCNGGMSTAKGEELPFWMQRQAQVMCPAQFDNASHYAIMIFLFLLGSFCQGFLFRRFGWGAKQFAPGIAAGIILLELLQLFQVIEDDSVAVYSLSMIFGIFVSIPTNCGIGTVPWAATGHMVSMGFKFGSWCSRPDRADLQAVLQTVLLWTAFLLGIEMGAIFHSSRTVMLCAMSLQGLLILNGMISTEPSAEARDATTESEGMCSNVDGHERSRQDQKN